MDKKPPDRIYETEGNAEKYGQRACNTYKGCKFGCGYCYVPLCPPFPSREEFRTMVTARDLSGIEQEVIRKMAKGMINQQTPVFFCFSCDPYQPLEKELQATRKALIALKNAGIPVIILTKNPELAMRDMDLFDKNTDWIGTTLTTPSLATASEWEPYAPAPIARISALESFKGRGYRVWVSLEPIIRATQSIAAVSRTAMFVDHYKMGLLNYAGRATEPVRKAAENVNREETEEAVRDAISSYGFTQTLDHTLWETITFYVKGSMK